jgi:hypothetical protein
MSLQIESNQQDPGDLSIEAADFETLLRVSMEELMVLTQHHQEAWHFGKEDQWRLDERQGQLVLEFPGRQVVAPAQIIGAYDIQAGLWQWAWAKPSFPQDLVAHALCLREYGEKEGFERLVSPEWPGHETDCWYMAALACRLCGAQGAYRAPSEDSFTFITFGEVEAFPGLHDAEALARNFLEQSAGEFRNCTEDPEQQKLACCRYFRRGPLAGLSQSELIEFLGLASPSVLDLAGYPPETAQQVMEIAGRLSEDEIHNS